jgi:hypothetical protein
MQVSTSLVEAYENYNPFGEVSFFVEDFKMEQRTAIELCVKLKKTTIEMFVMLKSEYGEEWLSRISVLVWQNMFREGREYLQGEERKCRPSTSGSEESTETVQKRLVNDRTFSARLLEQILLFEREAVPTY